MHLDFVNKVGGFEDLHLPDHPKDDYELEDCLFLIELTIDNKYEADLQQAIVRMTEGEKILKKVVHKARLVINAVQKTKTSCAAEAGAVIANMPNFQK